MDPLTTADARRLLEACVAPTMQQAIDRAVDVLRGAPERENARPVVTERRHPMKPDRDVTRGV